MTNINLKYLVIVLGLVALFLPITVIMGKELSTDRTTPPTLTLKGDTEITIMQGEPYQEPGYTATNAQGEDITHAVRTSSHFMDEAGTYEIRYSVKDSYGNSTWVTRTVHVKEKKESKKKKTAMKDASEKARGLSVLMYHDVYDENDPPDNVDANKIAAATLKEELEYLTEEGYYFPTWEEVKKFMEGEEDLPKKSVVLTFDDATKGFRKNGAPLLEEYDVLATSFVITSKNGEKMAKQNYSHITLQSHSHDMHRPGGNLGHGGVFTALSHDEAVEDLKTSQEILGTSDAFAYPFGDFNDDCKKAVEDAGFTMAFTTEYGRIHPGDDLMELKRMRVNGDISLETFKELL